MGEVMMGKRLGKRALAWGALFGVTPELLESLFFPLLDTARELACDRALGHSLVVMILGSWGIAHGLAKLWGKENISKAHAGCFVFTIWAVHVLVDCFSSEGAEVFWPFFSKRLTFQFLPELDFLFTVPVVAAVVWLACRREPKLVKTRGKKVVPPSPRRKLFFAGFAISAGYALIAVGMKFLVSAGFDSDLARRGTKYERRVESPTPFNILLWRSLVDRGGEIWVGYRSVFERSETPVRWTVYLKNAEALHRVAAMRETKTLMNRADGWWLARPYANGAWLGDLRFPEARVWGSKKGMVDSLLGVSWVIDPTLKKDHLRSFSPSSANSSDYFQRLFTRISGNRESWEANPRLAGVSGSLPEFLPVEE